MAGIRHPFMETTARLLAEHATFFRRNYELQSAAQIAALMFQELERFPDWEAR